MHPRGIAANPAGLIAAIGHWHAPAAHQVAVAAVARIPDQTRPQQRDHRAIAVVRVHASASDLNQVGPQRRQPVKVEFLLGVETAGPGGRRRGQDAIGSDHPVGAGVADQEMVAVGIEAVAVQEVRGRADSAQFVAEDLVAQALNLLDRRRAVRQRYRQAPAVAPGLR